jgi:hypothetical protein
VLLLWSRDVLSAYAHLFFRVDPGSQFIQVNVNCQTASVKEAVGLPARAESRLGVVLVDVDGSLTGCKGGYWVASERSSGLLKKV